MFAYLVLGVDLAFFEFVFLFVSCYFGLPLVWIGLLICVRVRCFGGILLWFFGCFRWLGFVYFGIWRDFLRLLVCFFVVFVVLIVCLLIVGL